MFDKKWVWLLMGAAAGYVLAPKLRTLPLFSKLPSL